MPVETIKCQECGSADVTEFKAGTYVCGHCEAVFKHVESSQGGHVACACGTFAIGRCKVCNTPVCEIHSRMGVASRLCEAHFAAEAAENARKARKTMEEERRTQPDRDRAAEADREAARRAAVERLLSERRAFQQSIPDPYERLCVALYRRTQPAGMQGNLGEICPELWESLPDSSDLENDPPWNGGDVAAWFARRAREIGIPPDDVIRPLSWGHTLFGKPKQIAGAAMPCWRFRDGSTRVSGEISRREEALVLADGRLYSADNLTRAALVQMAVMLERAQPQER